MDMEKMSEVVISYFRGNAGDFTPIAVSADFTALLRPVAPSKNDGEPVEKFAVPVQLAA